LDTAEYEALKLERDVRRRAALAISPTAREALAIEYAPADYADHPETVGADERRSA